MIELLTERGRRLRHLRRKLFVLLTIDALHTASSVDVLHTTGLSPRTVRAVLRELSQAGLIDAETETPELLGSGLPAGRPVRRHQVTVQGSRYVEDLAASLSQSWCRSVEGD